MNDIDAAIAAIRQRPGIVRDFLPARPSLSHVIARYHAWGRAIGRG